MSLRIAGGAVYFNPKVNGVLQGMRKILSTQGFPVNITPTKLASWNNDEGGIGVKENEVVVRTERSATMPTRDVTMETLADLFGADAVTVRSQDSGALAETITGVKQGRYYQLGVSASFPTGARNLSALTVEVAAVAKVIDVDYTVDLALGLLYIVPGGTIADDAEIDVAATKAAVTWDAVISGDRQAAGEMRIVGRNTLGAPIDHFFPNVVLSLNGEYQVKGDPENAGYAQLPIGVEILEDVEGGRAAIYIDGRPAA